MYIRLSRVWREVRIERRVILTASAAAGKAKAGSARKEREKERKRLGERLAL